MAPFKDSDSNEFINFPNGTYLSSSEFNEFVFIDIWCNPFKVIVYKNFLPSSSADYISCE